MMGKNSCTGTIPKGIWVTRRHTNFNSCVNTIYSTKMQIKTQNINEHNHSHYTNPINTYQKFAPWHSQTNKYHRFPTFAVSLDSLISQHRSASVNLPLTCYNGYNPNYTFHGGSR